MNNNCPVPNTGPCSIGMNSSSYANGAFYMDDQDTFVARTSPPSSPSDEQDVRIGRSCCANRCRVEIL